MPAPHRDRSAVRFCLGFEIKVSTFQLLKSEIYVLAQQDAPFSFSHYRLEIVILIFFLLLLHGHELAIVRTHPESSRGVGKGVII